MIIRTKKLVNESITPLFKEIKQEPDSTSSINIGTHFLHPYNSPTNNFLIIILLAELKELSDKKWFDILDLKNNGGVNVERSLFEKNKKYVPSVIYSGKNLYIQSNEFLIPNLIFLQLMILSQRETMQKYTIIGLDTLINGIFILMIMLIFLSR
ncbi:hypothetical protein I3679_011695 [Proteus mirabilis]|uniref:Uncharacterized protein n=1 Tax=Proteus mirabilis TaxID=584 RepID=A0ABD5LSY1_PROMI